MAEIAETPRETFCKCGNPRRAVDQRYCRECHAAHMRENRPKYYQLNEEQRRRDNCRSHANIAKRRGQLTPKPCEVCGKSAEMHHDDYGQALVVRWLCREHHLDLHNQELTH